MPQIRLAVSTDAAPLARLAEQTFRDTFAEHNTVADTALHCQASFSAALQAAEIANPGMLTLVCEEHGGLVAFAQLRWGTVPAVVPGVSAVELLRFYVARDWHGQGLAQALMTSCLDTIAQRGSDAVWLGVWEHNPRAMAFYRKFGFQPVGDHVFVVGEDRQRDILMARRIAGPQDPS